MVGASNLSFKNSRIQRHNKSMTKRLGYFLWPLGLGMLKGWVCLYDFWFTAANTEAGLT